MFLARKLRLPGAISGIPPDDCYSLRWEGVFQSFSTLSRYSQGDSGIKGTCELPLPESRILAADSSDGGG